jgi:hypothetical protein
MVKVNSQGISSGSASTLGKEQSNSNHNLLKIRNVDKCNNNKQVLGPVNGFHLSKNFIIIHQNICGILQKTDEFMVPLLEIAPQVLCIMEHHSCID